MITPRIGKPVEVQALWLNALRIGSGGSMRWTNLFESALGSFRERFWCEATGGLYDVIDVDHVAGAVDSSIRPNQIFAVGGLPLPLLDGERARRVIDQVERELLMSGGRGDVDVALAGIRAAQRAGFETIKINATVVKGQNDDTVLDLVGHFRGTGVIVRFIEFMDVGTLNGWKADRVVASRVLRDRIHARWPIEPLDRNYRGEVAERYAFSDGKGEIGFISSVTEPFAEVAHPPR